MKVISFFLCSRVAYTVPGPSFDIYGYWGERQTGVQLPLNATLATFLHLVFEENESGSHLLTVKVFDPNKDILAKADVPVTIEKTNLELLMPIVLGPMTVAHAGLHRLSLEVDHIYRIEKQIVVEGYSQGGLHA